MTLADVIAQLAVLAVILVGLAYRRDLPDFEDGNVERLEKDERAKEAEWWLVRLKRGYM